MAIAGNNIYETKIEKWIEKGITWIKWKYSSTVTAKIVSEAANILECEILHQNKKEVKGKLLKNGFSCFGGDCGGNEKNCHGIVFRLFLSD